MSLKSVNKTFKALADNNRTRIVIALMQSGELCACQLTELLQVSGATVSRHLSVLQNAQLILSRKDGRWIYFRLNEAYEFMEVIKNWLKQEICNDPPAQSDAELLHEIIATNPEELCRRQRGETCCP